MFYIKFGERNLIGASPEMLVRCTGKQLEYRPIAGTRKRGKNDAEDLILGKDLRADKKEVAEHIMLVDLGRNDLGRVAEYGSVKVAELMKIEKYSHVQHLVTSLKANLREGLDRFDALASCFPAGTVSGAPKVKADANNQRTRTDKTQHLFGCDRLHRLCGKSRHMHSYSHDQYEQRLRFNSGRSGNCRRFRAGK